METIKLYTNLNRVGSDILEIVKEHPELKEIIVVFPPKVYSLIENKEVGFRDVAIKVKEHASYLWPSSIYIANDFEPLPKDSEHKKVTILADTQLQTMTQSLLRHKTINTGKDPYLAEEGTPLKEIKNSELYLLEKLLNYAELEVKQKLMTDDYIYITEYFDAKNNPNLYLPTVGEEMVIIRSIENNVTRYYTLWPNTQEFLNQRSKYQAEYAIDRALKNNQENLTNILLAIECIKLKKELCGKI